VQTGARTAGVRLRQRKKGEKKSAALQQADRTGIVRHPNRSGPNFSIERRNESGGWSETRIATGWWEDPLQAMKPEIDAQMRAVMAETAAAAGFK
jgi:hypothetical protein